MKEEIVVVMVPFPAQSHLNQLLQLGCIISTNYAIPVHFLASTTHNRQARARASALNSSAVSNIQFHDLPTPDFSSPPPDPNASTKFPVQLIPAYQASMLLRHPVASFLQHMSSISRRVVVIHDVLMSYNVQDISSIPNAESYIFNCVSVLFMYSNFVCAPKGIPIPLEEELIKKMPIMDEATPQEIDNLVNYHIPYMDIRSGDLYNSNKVIEATSLDLMAQFAASLTKKQWAIGPILPPIMHRSSNGNVCLDWLDKQPPNSVIYVSFGSSTTFSDEEIRVLAIGLARSKQRFLWVLREADRGDIFSGEARRFELPEGFEEGVGLVVRDWAPQLEILAHPSTGGFMSHCGWNSCIEGITMGVPIAAWPMHSEQPLNGFFVTEILKTGVVVREWEKRKELVSASTIEDVVRKLMASEEGDVIRERAQKLGEAVRQSTKKGGSSQLEFDSFIAHIRR